MTDAASRPRLLVVAPRYDYIAPTSTIFFSGLEKRFDVVYWGPGYVPMDALGRDLRAVEDELGPFHAVLVHQFFILGTLAAARRSIAAAFPVGRFLERFPGFPVGIEALEAPRIGVMLILDPYALREADADRIDAFGGPIVSWPVDETIADDYFTVEDAIVPPSTVFHDFFSARPERLIPVHHFVADDEFDAIDWHDRRYQACVPGAAYGRRRQAKSRLAEAGIRVLDHSPATLAVKLLFAGQPYRSRTGLRLLQAIYRQGIRSSKTCFVEGSGFNFPVRKFIEVPAYGSALIAIPCSGARDIGLVDGETYVATDLAGVPDAVHSVLNEPERTLRIIDNAQSLVRRAHTQSARAEQFARCLEEIGNRRYHGARWHEGEFVLCGSPADTLEGHRPSVAGS